MRKKNRILWVGILIVAIICVVGFQKGILNISTSIAQGIKGFVYDAQSGVKNAINEHFNQAKEIARLREVERQKEESDMLVVFYKNRLEHALELYSSNPKPNFKNTRLIEAYSYVNMGKYEQVWLKGEAINLSNEDNIFGLVRNSFAAGIATIKDNKLLGILNGDPKASYGVYVGESRFIGTLKTSLSGKIVVDYINAWNEINIGDEVITNGLDGIFFEGIKVGVIKNVAQEYGYIVAEVEPYEKNQHIGYFWLIDVDGDF